ncbi:hypothetical protein Rleg10DRAFT_5636 [Rhizobium leguminosarum bv. trifolii WSM2012]|nr:hypothetical protein Rleg10DRAFT_4350 [Rhizobium leguminosarum bv. trifolii WSM2012]EJC76944.1 hypothetical protein Rleg10DRAFT_5636 [Rhizobium leguminosarum bv. trifolii WSM2012]
MVKTSNNVHPNIDSNQLPRVFRAVLDYIAMTGINPGLVYDLEINPLHATIDFEGQPVPIQFREKPQSASSSKSSCAGAFKNYVELYRPELVQKFVANGKQAPKHLFLMDDGTPITVEAFQRTLLKAIAKQRLPEITTLECPARCVRPSTSAKPRAPLFAHAKSVRRAILHALQTSSALPV